MNISNNQNTIIYEGQTLTFVPITDKINVCEECFLLKKLRFCNDVPCSSGKRQDKRNGAFKTTKQLKSMDTSNLSIAELESLLQKKKESERQAALNKREAYEGIRSQLIHNVMQKVEAVTNDAENLHKFVKDETEAFRAVMAEYGQLRTPQQMSYRIQNEKFRIEVKSNKVKKFDERADVAAARLIQFLQDWIKNAPGGSDNPMYQLAMVLLDRNKQGDLDYKNISKLYELESKFADPEYADIMALFKESHLVEGTAINYYFYRRDDLAVWRKIEPSFNRM
jgi:hypothetical protein